MTRLTEQMIIARSRESNLGVIKKLNFWGNDLTDISMCRKLTAIEVLALSLNDISSLKDLEDCHQLRELYLRKNKIKDLGELSHLKGLPKLKTLLLQENPCVEAYGTNYRSTVIQLLPELEVLDSITISSEERENALSTSKDSQRKAIDPEASETEYTDCSDSQRNGDISPEDLKSDSKKQLRNLSKQRVGAKENKSELPKKLSQELIKEQPERKESDKALPQEQLKDLEENSSIFETPSLERRKTQPPVRNSPPREYPKLDLEKIPESIKGDKNETPEPLPKQESKTATNIATPIDSPPPPNNLEDLKNEESPFGEGFDGQENIPPSEVVLWAILNILKVLDEESLEIVDEAVAKRVAELVAEEKQEKQDKQETSEETSDSQTL